MMRYGITLGLALPNLVLANDGSSTAYAIWIAVCIALVLLMQVGFLLLEGGMVRSKNAVNVILKNFADVGLGTFGYWAIGFGIMYGVNPTGWFGTSDFLPNFEDNQRTLDLLYDVMFAATAATIMSGAVAERFSFLPYVVGAFFVTAVVYPIFGSWAWSDDGWLNALGFYDAAGATVVHSIGGWCALGALILIGPRHGRYSRKGEIQEIAGHNLPFVAIGGLILWFGWFGFNGGIVADDFSNLGQILLNTHLAAVGGLIGAIALMAALREGFYITKTINGTLGGLVSVTAASDILVPGTALLAGFFGGVIVVSTSNLLNRLRIDDVVGAVPVHGFCGAWGTLVVGLFYQGDMFNLERIMTQLIGIIVAFIWGLGTAYGIFWCLNRVHTVRVTKRQEQRGLDISEHAEVGYSDFMVNHARADM